MAINENKVRIAADLVPIMKWLEECGIIRVDGYLNMVHTTEEFFRETFPVYTVHERGNKEYPYELSYVFNGVTFFTLSAEK